MSIEQQFLDLHPRSAELFQSASDVFPGGVTHDVRYLQPFPIVMATGQGSRKIDIDDLEYIDYVMGHGALLLGHSHPDIVNAVTEQIQLGTHLGSNTKLELDWAKAIQQLMPSIERVRFNSSGTEATQMAMRLARAFTGRSKVLRFEEHFHGWHDYAAATPTNKKETRFAGPGIPAELGHTVTVIPVGDADLVENILDQDDDIAAVILEPTGAGCGRIPLAPEFVHHLRSITKKHNVVLIFDEVVTGFRVSPGGAQERLGIRPDLTTMAKIVAGGLPGAAVGGRSDIMDQIDMARSNNRIPHPGTFNANPLSAAAGCACLTLVHSEPLTERAERAAIRLCGGMNKLFVDIDVQGFSYRDASMVQVALNIPGDGSSDSMETALPLLSNNRGANDVGQRFRLALLNEGIDAMRGVTYIVSAVHSDSDIDTTLGAFGHALENLRAEGIVQRRINA